MPKSKEPKQGKELRKISNKVTKRLDRIVTDAPQPGADELPVVKTGFGQETFYEERFDEIAFDMACKGLTQANIAARFGVTPRTLRKWMEKHPSLKEAMDAGYAVSVGNVENALYRAATGFTYEEEVLNKNGEVVKLKKYEKPNTTAIIFYLCNRDRKNWKNVNRVEHTAEDGKPLTVHFNIPRPEIPQKQVINVEIKDSEIKELPEGK